MGDTYHSYNFIYPFVIIVCLLCTMPVYFRLLYQHLSRGVCIHLIGFDIDGIVCNLGNALFGESQTTEGLAIDVHKTV